MKEKGVRPVPPKNERPSNSSTNLRYKQHPISTQNSVVNLSQDSLNSEEKNTKEMVTPIRSRKSSYCSSIQNDGNRARISNLLKNLDKNSRKFVLENLRSMDSWNKALVDEESTDSDDSKRNTDNFQSHAIPSFSSHDKNIVTTEAARQKMRKKVELRKPKQLMGLQTNAVTQQCRAMRETTKKNKLDMVMKEMYKMQLQSEIESLNAQAITIPLLHEGTSSTSARRKDQSIQLKAISCVHAWTLRAINNVMRREMLKYASHTKTKANQLWAKRMIVRIWRRYKLCNLMDRIVAIQQDEREAYHDSVQIDESAFRQRIKLREFSEDVNSLRLKSSEYKSYRLQDSSNNTETALKTTRIKSLCCQETRKDLAPFSTIINQRIIDGGFNSHISWQVAATVRQGHGQLGALDSRYKDADREGFNSSVIKVIEKMSRLEDYESRKKSLCTTMMKPILTIHNVEIRGVQYL